MAGKLGLQIRRDLTFYETSHRASAFRNVHEGKTGIVLGNGESRLAYDLFELDPDGVVLFACNAYYRDVLAGKQPPCAYLGAVDRQISKEIVDSGWVDDNWTLLVPANLKKMRPPANPPPRLIEFDYNANFNCGIEMVQFALLTGCSPVVLMGFDGSEPTNVNNVYKGTPCYSDEKSCKTRVTTWQLSVVADKTSTSIYRIGSVLEFDEIDFKELPRR